MNTSFDSRTSVTPKPMINISKHPRSQFRPNPACDTFCSQHYPSGRPLNPPASGDPTGGPTSTWDSRHNAAAVQPCDRLDQHRALTGQRLSREWRGTEQTMGDQTDQTDPTQKYDQPENTERKG